MSTWFAPNLLINCLYDNNIQHLISWFPISLETWILRNHISYKRKIYILFKKKYFSHTYINMGAVISCIKFISCKDLSLIHIWVSELLFHVTIMRQQLLKRITVCAKSHYTARCRYNAVIFLQNHNKKFLCVLILIYILYQSLQWCVQYHSR